MRTGAILAVTTHLFQRVFVMFYVRVYVFIYNVRLQNSPLECFCRYLSKIITNCNFMIFAMTPRLNVVCSPNGYIYERHGNGVVLLKSCNETVLLCSATMNVLYDSSTNAHVPHIISSTIIFYFSAH